MRQSRQAAQEGVRLPNKKSGIKAQCKPVLSQLLIGLSAGEKVELRERFWLIIRSTILLASPLSTTSLASLLDITRAAINDGLDMLHSVLAIPSLPTAPIRLVHISFRGFLLDPEKQGSNAFWVDEKEAHERLANNCLQVMEKHLHTDMCRL
jgi:hypothetical protein